jgi:hypothetical protein
VPLRRGREEHAPFDAQGKQEWLCHRGICCRRRMKPGKGARGGEERFYHAHGPWEMVRRSPRAGRPLRPARPAGTPPYKTPGCKERTKSARERREISLCATRLPRRSEAGEKASGCFVRNDRHGWWGIMSELPSVVGTGAAQTPKGGGITHPPQKTGSRSVGFPVGCQALRVCHPPSQVIKLLSANVRFRRFTNSCCCIFPIDEAKFLVLVSRCDH